MLVLLLLLLLSFIFDEDDDDGGEDDDQKKIITPRRQKRERSGLERYKQQEKEEIQTAKAETQKTENGRASASAATNREGFRNDEQV